MKKLAGCLALLLCLLFITGCLPANDAEPLLAPAAEVRQIAVPVRTPEETQTSTDVLFYVAKQLAREKLGLKPGDKIVITGGVINGKSGNTNLIKVEVI